MLFRIILVLVWCGFASPTMAQVWPNKPAAFGTILDCQFNVKPTPSRDPAGCGIENGYNAGAIVTDSTAPLSPSNVYKSWISAGQSTGGTQLNYVTPAVYNEMYVGMMWRTNPEFFGRTVVNKMWFMRGPTTNHFFGMNGCPGQGQSTCYIEFGHNTGTLDNSHACAEQLGLVCHANVGNATVQRGVWTKLEAYMKKSTTATSRDGIVRWWINGVLVGNYTNLNVSPLGINEWVWSETWDGFVNPPPTQEWAHFLDHLTIAVSGGGAVLDNPPGAPGLVTGFTATPGGVQ